MYIYGMANDLRTVHELKLGDTCTLNGDNGRAAVIVYHSEEEYRIFESVCGEWRVDTYDSFQDPSDVVEFCHDNIL